MLQFLTEPVDLKAYQGDKLSTGMFFQGDVYGYHARSFAPECHRSGASHLGDKHRLTAGRRTRKGTAR